MQAKEEFARKGPYTSADHRDISDVLAYSVKAYPVRQSAQSLTKIEQQDVVPEQRSEEFKDESFVQFDNSTDPGDPVQAHKIEEELNKRKNKRYSDLQKSTSDFNSMLETNNTLGGLISGQTSSTEDGQHGLAVVVSSCIQWLKFQDYIQTKGHTQYVLRLRARTKFMKGMISEDGCSEFIVNTRYSELLILKEQIQKEIKEELAKDIYDKSFKRFPKFPGKKFYNKMEHNFVVKRMSALENYFEELFEQFPDIMKYSQALIKFCKPKDVEVCLIGSAQCGKTSFIQALCRDFNFSKLKPKKKTIIKANPLLQFRKTVNSRVTQKAQTQGDIVSKENEEPKIEKLLPEVQKDHLKRGSLSLRRSQIDAVKVAQHQEVQKMLPIDIVVNETLLRLDVREFYEDQITNGRALNYCKDQRKQVIFLLNTEQKGSASFIKPQIAQWLRWVKSKQKDEIPPKCAVVALSEKVQYCWRGANQDLDDIHDLLCGSNSSTGSLCYDDDLGFFCELSLQKKGETGNVIKTLLCGGKWLASMRERISKESFSEEDSKHG